MNGKEKLTTIHPENTLLNNKGINSFESDIIQVTNNNGSNYNPSIFIDDLDRLWMVWGNGSGNDGIIWATYSSEPFNNWTEPFRLTHDPAVNEGFCGFSGNQIVMVIMISGISIPTTMV
jgi:hypothetical protein